MDDVDYKSIVGVIPRDRFAGPRPPILIFWYDNNKDLKDAFLQHIPHINLIILTRDLCAEFVAQPGLVQFRISGDWLFRLQNGSDIPELGKLCSRKKTLNTFCEI